MSNPKEGHMESGRDRIVEIWEASRAALQGVVRDLKITQEELGIAGRYFNRLGQSGMFPSLLAVGLAMTSVDATRAADGGTRPNLEGPFHKPGAPLRRDGSLLDADAHPEAARLRLFGRVLDAATGQPLAGAELDFWQADDTGTYDNTGFHLRGVVKSDARGQYLVRTIVPRDYSEHDGDPIGELFSAMGRHNRRAAHIHLKASMPGYVALTTQLFMPTSDYLDSDYVEGAVSPDLTLDFVPGGDEGASGFDAAFDVSLRRDPAA
jgi:catechol 1,2-dioxygenase